MISAGFTREIMLLLFLFTCGICDLEQEKIPNWLAACGVWTGLVFSGSLNFFLWSLAGIAIIFVINLFGFLGGGDAKMWMGAACIGGFAFSCLTVAVAGAILIIVAAIRGDRGAVKAAWGNARFFKMESLTEEKGGTPIPFAPYMFFGCAACCGVLAITSALSEAFR